MATIASPRVSMNHTDMTVPQSTKNIRNHPIHPSQVHSRNRTLEKSEKLMTKPILGGFMSHFSNAGDEHPDRKWAFGAKFSRQEPAQTKFLVGMNERT